MDNTIENFFIDFLKKIPNISNEIEAEKKKLPPQFNIIQYLGRHTDEVKNSNLLKNVLQIEFTNDNKDISFTKLFIDYLNEDLSEKIVYSNENKSIVAKEVSTNEGRRIDILIKIGDTAIIIENKINAGDGGHQLDSYYNDIERKNYENIYIVYLTRYGSIPAIYSLSEEHREKLGEKFICISHGDIGHWLEDILNSHEYDFIKTDDNYKLLYSALIQVIQNEKALSGKSKEDNVEDKIIEEAIGKIIENRNMNEAMKCINIAKKAYYKIYEESYFKFYSEIEKELKNKKIEGLITDSNSRNVLISKVIKAKLDKAVVRNKDKYLSHIFKIQFDDNFCISVQYSYEPHRKKFGLLGDNKNQSPEGSINRKFQDIKNSTDIEVEMKNIFGVNDSNQFWHISKKIDEKNDTPKDIAEKIYALYNLLKSKGFEPKK